MITVINTTGYKNSSEVRTKQRVAEAKKNFRKSDSPEYREKEYCRIDKKNQICLRYTMKIRAEIVSKTLKIQFAPDKNQDFRAKCSFLLSSTILRNFKGSITFNRLNFCRKFLLSALIPVIRSSKSVSGTKISDLMEASAIDLLADSLRTPLQIEYHLRLAFEAAYQIGEKPITAAIVESVLSKQMNDLEPTLTRNGYNVTSLAERFNATTAEFRAFFRGHLEPVRMRDLQKQMLSGGLPI